VQSRSWLHLLARVAEAPQLRLRAVARRIRLVVP